jgi:hypothetical protein
MRGQRPSLAARKIRTIALCLLSLLSRQTINPITHSVRTIGTVVAAPRARGDVTFTTVTSNRPLSKNNRHSQNILKLKQVYKTGRKCIQNRAIGEQRGIYQ